MNEKQNPRIDPDDSSPTPDKSSRDHAESPAKSYYYDDATGYEIYDGESDDEDEEDIREET